MKAISLWQPWASAIPIGHKRIETRGWSTNYRGLLAIHAAKRWTKEQREFAAVERALGRLPQRLPLGAIIAVVTVEECLPTWQLRDRVHPIEKLYGDYGDGRFGWLLKNIVALPEPIPFAGAQGFFNVPDELFPEALRPVELLKDVA